MVRVFAFSVCYHGSKQACEKLIRLLLCGHIPEQEHGIQRFRNTWFLFLRIGLLHRKNLYDFIILEDIKTADAVSSMKLTIQKGMDCRN